MNFDLNRKKQITVIRIALLITFTASETAIAQIIPDRTLPKNSMAIPMRNRTEIRGGTQRENNLFHSFEQFSLPQGEAFFNNANSIKNIFSRVTGNFPSNIDGLIRANGTANLFLLNPNGIIFGANARLDIGGSFIGTTAERILFADGFEFSAKNPSNSPLLTVSVPIGLGFGANPKPIQVQGVGHQLFFLEESAGLASPIFGSGQSVTGLRSAPRKTIALIGGQVLFNGGIITTPSGQIEIGSVRDGKVHLYSTNLGFSFQYETSNFNDIQLTQRSLLDASGILNGQINLRGRNLYLDNDSKLIISSFGNLPGSEIQLNVTESAILTRGSIDTQNFAQGNGANILISARNLIIQDFSSIATRTFASGAGGEITVKLQDSLQVFGQSFEPSSIGSFTIESSGKAGNLHFFAENFYIQNGGLILSQSLGKGNGGNIEIDASGLVEISGSLPVDLATESFIPSSVGTTTVSSGTAGNVFISTRSLKVTNGGGVNATTVAGGDAGNITVNATELIEVSGAIPNTNRQLSANLSQIFASADRANPFLSRLFNLPEIPKGVSGDIRLNTKKLIVQDAGRISVINDGTGNAGTLSINSPSIFLDNAGSLSATTASGRGGNININSNDLRLNNSSITATAGGTGNGGDITINTDTLVGLNNSTITANAFKGRGGNIAIATRGFFLSPDSSITATSELGVDGTVQIEILQPTRQEPIVQTPTIMTEQLLVTSCFNRTEARGTFNLVGQSGLPLKPDSGFDSEGEAVKIPKPSQSVSVRHEDSPVARSQRPWQIGDPVVEPDSIVKTPDGQVRFVKATVSQTPLTLEELICEPEFTK